MTALLRQGHISLLSFCQTPKIQSDLPSWVPDWSRSTTDMLQDVDNDHVTLYPKFSASGAESCHSKNSTIGRYGTVEGISVVGHIHDEIYKVGSFPGRASSQEVPLSETFSWPTKWLVETLRLTYQDKKGNGNFSNRLRAAARTSIGGVGYNQDTQLVRVEDDRFSQAVVLLENGIKYIRENHIKLELRQLLATRAVKDRVETSVAVNMGLGSEIMGKSLGRLPFIIRKGNLALGSEYVKRDDLVALIRGAQFRLFFAVKAVDSINLLARHMLTVSWTERRWRTLNVVM